MASTDNLIDKLKRIATGQEPPAYASWGAPKPPAEVPNTGRPSTTPKAPPAPTTSTTGGGGAGFSASPTSTTRVTGSRANTSAPTSGGGVRAGFWNYPQSTWTADEVAAWNAMQPASAGAASSGSSTAAADLAERQREFDVTTQRDIAKEGATELDALQKLLLGQTGPKDPYAYLFNSRGLTTPQGYKPVGVPLTDAQQAGWLKANPGMTPQDLQAQLTGGGVAPNWAQSGGTLGNMPQSMATSNPSVNPQALQAQTSPVPPQVAPAPNPQQVTQGVQNYMATPALQANVAGGAPTLPVPSMAGGGQVSGPPGTPSLAVVHGGEEVIPAPGGPPQMPGAQGAQPPQGQDMQNSPGLHPAIAALIDAMSGLLQNPDFAPFVKGTLQSTQATPGGAPSMAAGGTVPPPPGGVTGAAATSAPPASSTPTNTANPDVVAQETFRETGRYAAPVSVPPSPGALTVAQSPTGLTPSVRGAANPGPAAPPIAGTPLGGAQGVTYNTGAVGPVDKPIMPINKMDPYSQALYDVMGRLHPYSAQQEAQMGPSGLAGVNSYVGKVEGADVTDYTSLAERLKPNRGAPSASTGTAQGGFTFG